MAEQILQGSVKTVQTLSGSLRTGAGIAIDSTLTKAGQAADAKAAGDRLAALSEAIGDLSGLNTGDKSSLVAAINEVLASGGGESGGEEPTSYTVKNQMTNASTNNTIPRVSAGASYTSKLTAADGYVISAVTVTMGGTDITATAWDAETSKVTIASVTGDVVITCTGTAQSSGPADTSPVIEQSGYALGTSASPGAASWACYTAAYPVDGSVDLTLKYHLPNYDGISLSNNNKLHAFLNREYVTYYTMFFAASSSDGERSSKTEIRYGTYDALKFTLVEAYKDDSYLYIDGTGEIIFAGKNTKYYGMSNIDGTIAGGGSGGSNTANIAAEVDNAVMMLAMTTGETAVASDYSSLTEEYVAMVQANYDAMMAECLGDFNKIPLIIHTDQHGKMSDAAGADILKLIGTITNWYEIGKCINLGDTCGNTFTSSTLQSYLDNAADYIPLSKRVEVYGNHDIWDSDDSRKYTVSQKRLSPYFKNIYARRHGNNGYFTIPDDYFNVKYLVINNMEYPNTNYGQNRMTTAQANFLVSELSANDGYDIIILSHIPFTASGLTSRDPDYYDFSENFLYDTTANASLQAMLSARKNHSSGTFTDSEGLEHAYDFSNVSGKLLMSLHGHEHWEGYTTLENSITEFVFASVNASSELENRTESTTFYFGYIDRENMKFKCWRNESGYDALEISIA